MSKMRATDVRIIFCEDPPIEAELTELACVCVTNERRS